MNAMPGRSRWLPLLAFVCLTTPTTPLSAQSLREAPAVQGAIARLEVWTEEQRSYREIPSVAVAVLRGDEVIWTKSLGEVSPATRFRVGSVSKMFTATAVLLLRDDGKLSLDDPIVQHLPWFAVQSPYTDAGPIRIRHLLTHTSGLPREGAFPYWTTHLFPSREELHASLPTQTAFSPPGDKYRYSNLGVALLGEIIEQASGLPYAEFLKRRIFLPLGMTSTTAAPTATEIAALAPAHQRKPRSGGQRPPMHYYDTGTFTPMGGVISTLADMTKFAALHLSAAPSGVPASGRQILSGATLAEMQRIQFISASFTGARGLGFAVSRREDRTYVSHAGWIGGHRADFILDPARDLAAIAFTNADDASPSVFARQALSELGTAIDRVDREAAPPAKPKQADPKWQRYRGTYTDPWGWEYQVLILEGELAMYEHNYPPEDDPDLSITKLDPVPELGEHTYRMGDQELLRFEINLDGTVKRVQRRHEYLEPVRR